MADSLTIITNNVPRWIIDGWELTPKEREEFDYIKWSDIESGNDSRQFFRYKGQLYDLNDMMSTSGLDTFRIHGWDGYISDTFFSGILVKYVYDFEQVICGRYYC